MKKLFDKKRKNKGFSLVELIVVVAIMAVLMAVLVPTLVRNVEKSRQQKDKTAIAELRQAIVNAMSEEKCLYATANAQGTTADNGEVIIEKLFGPASAATDAEASAKTAAASNKAIIDEVKTTIGDSKITLTSKYVGAKLTLKNFSPADGTVVLEVDDTDADDFYIDAAGQHANLYTTAAANN